jgi:cysteinyl-tRNA synthetase
MRNVLVTDKLFCSFYETIKMKQRQRQQGHHEGGSRPPNDTSDVVAFQLQDFLLESKKQVNSALSDDFDTPGAMKVLVDLVNATTSSFSLNREKESIRVVSVAADVARYVTHVLQVFGVIPDIYVDGAMIAYGGNGFDDYLETKVLTPFLDAIAKWMTVQYDKDAVAKDVREAVGSLSTDLLDLGVEFCNINEAAENASDGKVEFSWKRVDY